MGLLVKRSNYKPFEFPWAYEYYKKHEAIHWLPEEVEFRNDIRDWNFKITSEEKNLLTHLLRFFTQADCDVADGYYHRYIPKLGNSPEILMMMGSFANRENVHKDAYSTLIETLALPEDTYTVFTEYQVMQEKHEYALGIPNDTPEDLLKNLAVYSAFTEGMQLFSSFAILMNFERFNKMKGMCNIVRWSIRDESMHVEGMTRLFRELWSEAIDDPREKVKLIKEIRDIALKMVELEDAFIDLCFEQGGIEGLTSDEVKKYIRFIANKRWTQLGFHGTLYENETENSLKWLDWVVNGTEHTNFFEARPTEYSKGTLTDEGDIEW